MPNDLRTEGIILRRTNYGESDRILNFLTPVGKVSALARGVRKEKSRLAGGIELFSISDIVIHQKSDSGPGILTGAKMLRFYQSILADLPRLELASSFLKRLDRAAEQADNPEYFSLLDQSLAGLNRGLSLELVSTWFNFNYARSTGEEINLLRDVNGDNLRPETNYLWDVAEDALRPAPKANGAIIDARAIKLARLMLTSKLSVIAKVTEIEQVLPALAPISARYSR